MIRARHRVLGVTAATDQRNDAVARLETLDPGADFGHRAGDLEPENFRIAGRRRVIALALDHVGTVDRGVDDLDQDLTVACRRGVDFVELQYFGTAELAQRDCFH